MEDAQRLFGRVSTAVQKIVKRDKKPREIVSTQTADTEHSALM